MLLVLWLACARDAAPEIAAEGTVHTIDGRAVTAAEWERQRARLVGEQHDWSCAETTDGGIVEYRMQDAAGSWWRVSETSAADRPDERALWREPAP